MAVALEMRGLETPEDPFMQIEEDIPKWTPAFCKEGSNNEKLREDMLKPYTFTPNSRRLKFLRSEHLRPGLSPTLKIVSSYVCVCFKLLTP